MTRRTLLMILNGWFASALTTLAEQPIVSDPNDETELINDVCEAYLSGPSPEVVELYSRFYTLLQHVCLMYDANFELLGVRYDSEPDPFSEGFYYVGDSLLETARQWGNVLDDAMRSDLGLVAPPRKIWVGIPTEDDYRRYCGPLRLSKPTRDEISLYSLHKIINTVSRDEVRMYA